METADKKCPICNGKKEQGKVTFCSVCGEERISDEVAENIEAVVSEAKMKNRMIEVVNFSLESVA